MSRAKIFIKTDEVRSRLAARGWSQNKFATEIGHSPNTLCNALAHRITVGNGLMASILDTLSASFYDVFEIKPVE